MYDPAVAHTIEKFKDAVASLQTTEGGPRDRLAKAWRQVMWVTSKDLPRGPCRDAFITMNERLGGRPDPRPLPLAALSDEEVGAVSDEVRGLFHGMNGRPF